LGKRTASRDVGVPGTVKLEGGKIKEREREYGSSKFRP